MLKNKTGKTNLVPIITVVIITVIISYIVIQVINMNKIRIGKTVYIDFNIGTADYLESLLEPENEKDYSNKLILLDREAVEQLIRYMRDNDVRIVPGEYKISQTSNYDEIMNILDFETIR